MVERASGRIAANAWNGLVFVACCMFAFVLISAAVAYFLVDEFI